VLVFVFIENKEDRDINNKNFVKKNKWT
jgi:hypothetical protein